ncbi:MAG: hypothetical protein ACO1RT_10930 [Planctomycetaceae bacterium]
MSSPSLDEFIERIVREVIRRLRAEHEGTKPGESNFALTERLITAATIESIPAGTREITIAERAILTPLARDEARDRGIRIIRQSKRATT